MTGASNPKFARKNLELKLINKAPLKHAHDDEVTCSSLDRMQIANASTSGASIRNVVPNGMASDIMHIKKRQYV